MAYTDIELFKSKLDWAMPFQRTGKFPLDRTSIFDSYEDALKYAKGDGSDERALGGTSYVGQLIIVNGAGSDGSTPEVAAYVIGATGESPILIKLAQTTASGDLAADVAALQSLTSQLKNKLDTVEEGAQVNVVEGLSVKGSGQQEYTPVEIEGTTAKLDLSAYATKEEVSSIPKFKLEVVDELPTEDISSTSVYLVRTTDVENPEDSNIYTEYIYINNHWEILGRQKLDLSIYATKEELEKAQEFKPVICNMPFRTLSDKVYTEEEILNWFWVKTKVELKQVVNGHPIYLRYGISLSGNPMYYYIPCQYVAFKDANTLEMITDGLDTSNDKFSRYHITIKLNGTIIEGNSNIKVELLDKYALKEDIPDLMSVGMYYPGVKVDSQKLFALTKESTETDIKAALQLETASGEYKLPTAAMLDDCLGKGYQLLSNWMPVSIAWNGAAYVFYTVGQNYMMKPTGLYTVALKITPEGQYSVFQAAKVEEFADVNDLDAYVTKEEGKGLSTNDFTNEAKAKLDNLAVIKTVNEQEFDIDENGQLVVKAISTSKVSGLNEALEAAGKIKGILLGTQEAQVDESGKVTIPMATKEALGLVKASDEISVGADGTLGLGSVDVQKLTVKEGDTLILNGGVAE